MQFKLASMSADAISGNVVLTLQVFDAGGYASATATLQFHSIINPGESVQAFNQRIETEARAALQAAANYSKPQAAR
jgi:hypothetical protein